MGWGREIDACVCECSLYGTDSELMFCIVSNYRGSQCSECNGMTHSLEHAGNNTELCIEGGNVHTHIIIHVH